MLGRRVDGSHEPARGGAHLWPLGADDQLAHVVGIAHGHLGQGVALVWPELQDESARLGHLVQPTHQLQVLRLNRRVGGNGARAVIACRIRRGFATSTSHVAATIGFDDQ